MRRQPAVDVVLEPAARARALRSSSLIEIDANGIDDDGAGSPEVVDRCREDLDDLRVRRVAFVRLPQDADATTLQAVLLERREVVGNGRGVSAGTEVAGDRRVGDGDGIVGIGPGDHLQHRDGILERARHRAGDVGQQIERYDARAAGEAHRRADAGERLVRRRSTNGVARVAPEADGAEVGGDGRGRAAARARRHSIERVRILRVARQDRADGLVRRKRELGHVRLGQHDRAGSLDALDLECIAGRHEAFERERACRALEADGLEVVLDDCRDAVERARKCPLLGAAIELVGLRQRLWIDQDDGVDRRPGLVVRLDPLRGTARRAPARQLTGFHRRVNSARWSSLRAGTRAGCCLPGRWPSSPPRTNAMSESQGLAGK